MSEQIEKCPSKGASAQTFCLTTFCGLFQALYVCTINMFILSIKLTPIGNVPLLDIFLVK